MGTFVWALTFLVLGALIVWRVDVQTTKHQQARQRRWEAMQETQRHDREISAQEKAIELMERENAAKLAALTLDEQAMAEKARLEHEAAEARQATEIDRAVMAEKIEAEKRAIAAYSEGRAEGERLRGLEEGQQADEDDDDYESDFEALMSAYEDYRSSGGTHTLGGWLQGSGLSFTNGRVSREAD